MNQNDGHDESLSPNHSQPGAPQPSSSKPSGSNSSGLTLVLPPLKGGKPVKATKKSKGKSQLGHQSVSPSGVQNAATEEQKIIRPVKLKPLKEVLAKLIAQIKKYFFNFHLCTTKRKLTTFLGKMTMHFF
jgi:bromodomain-containing protein 7/9